MPALSSPTNFARKSIHSCLMTARLRVAANLFSPCFVSLALGDHMHRLTFGFCCLALLAACVGKPSLNDPLISDRKLHIEQFFDGTIVGQGQYQTVLGKVRRSFTVTMHGDWDGKKLRLVEDFAFEDGTTDRRVWSLVKTGEGRWRGTAPNVIGEATGIEDGNRFNWRYTIDLPVPDATGVTKIQRVEFNDWMWLLADDRIFNRAYMKRLGFGFGDVSISFEKVR